MENLWEMAKKHGISNNKARAIWPELEDAGMFSTKEACKTLGISMERLLQLMATEWKGRETLISANKIEELMNRKAANAKYGTGRPRRNVGMKGGE